MDLSYLRPIIRGNDFIFVDDSYYSGTTRDIINAELNKYGGKITRTFVVYDGSKEKDDSVFSLYRYYDEK